MVRRSSPPQGTKSLHEPSSAVLDHALEHDARVLGIRIADALDVVGLLAVEMFLMDGVLVVNEVAARPHSSGHLTIDVCATSQLENHLRAILDWPTMSAAARQLR